MPEAFTHQGQPPAVEVDHLCCQLGNQPILTDISFALHPGECLAVVGANGAGKTTLLRHLIGLQRPTKGRIRIKGRDTAGTPISDLARDVGLAFQNPDNQFFRLTVDQEIRVGPETLGTIDTSWLEELMAIFHLEAPPRSAHLIASAAAKKNAWPLPPPWRPGRRCWPWTSPPPVRISNSGAICGTSWVSCRPGGRPLSL